MIDEKNTNTEAENKSADAVPIPVAAASAPVSSAPTSSAPAAPTSGFSRKRGGKPSFKREIIPSEFVEKVVSINRITKVTKGGKKMSFSALVVVGDGKGRVGYSLEKSNEVATSIKKALVSAKRNMIRIPINNMTIAHEIIGTCGAASVLLKPALEGTGVIAAGPVRAICDAVGIRNILTKCHKSNNPINVIKATMNGLTRLKAAATVGVEAPQAVKTEETKNANS